MFKDVLDELKGLSEREKFLTIGGIIAFPVDLIALVELFRRVFNYQQSNSNTRPEAVDINLPPMLASLWDRRVLDALTLTILLYSAAILLFLLYRRNLSLTIQELKRRNEGIKEQRLAIVGVRLSSAASSMTKEHLLLSSLLASILVNSIWAPLLWIWLRVFVIYGEPRKMTLGFAFLVTTSLFSYVFLALRTGDYYFLDYNTPNTIWETVGKSTEPLRDWFFGVNKSLSSPYGILLFLLIRILIAAPVLVIWFVTSLFATYILHKDRSIKALLTTFYISAPSILFVYKGSIEMSWIWSIMLTIITNFLLIPCLWGGDSYRIHDIGAYLCVFVYPIWDSSKGHLRCSCWANNSDSLAAQRIAVSCAAGGRGESTARRLAGRASKLRLPPDRSPYHLERRAAAGEVRRCARR